MPTVRANGLDIHHEPFGDPSDPTILLVAGLGAHCVSWDDQLCAGLVERGFHVVRFDNRDVGLSTHLTEGANYLLADMAADTIGLMDALGLEHVHLVGRSMGGMIAQTLAIEYPARVLTLVSIMSNTGEADIGQPDEELLAGLLEMANPPVDRADAFEKGVALSRLLGSPTIFDEDYARRLQELMLDRQPDPAGVGRQMLAVVGSPPRTEGLAALAIPTLVIHGEEDRLVAPSGGRRTAELVPGARLVEIPEMAHDLPPVLWPTYVALIADFIAEASRA
jgi:pimeloyl-ACP methyl ester carboxylesterase